MLSRSVLIKSSMGVAFAAILVVSAFLVFKKDITHYAIVQFLNGRGISIDFNVEKITAKEIHLTDVVLAEKIRIPRVHLNFNGLATSVEALKAVDVDIETVDIPVAMEIAKKLQNPPSKSDEPADLVKSCHQLSGIEIKIHLKQATWNEMIFPVNFDFTHNALESPFHGKFDGRAGKLPASGDVQVDSVKYAGSFEGNCKEELAVTSTFHAKADVRQGDHRFHVETGSIVADATIPSGSPISPQVKFAVSDASMSNERSPLIQGLFLAGSAVSIGDRWEVTASLTDASKTLHFKNTKVVLNKDGSLEARLPKTTSFIRLNDNMASLSPYLGELIKSASGQLYIYGSLRKTVDTFSGPLKLEGLKINLDSEYGKFYNLNFSHDVISPQTLKSSPGRALTLGMVDAGTILTGLVLKYQVFSKEKIEVQKMEVHYEGADIVTNDFVVHPFRPDLKHFKAQITKLPLDKMLALGLKDAVAAEGLLSGHVNVTFRKKVPIFEGRLTVDGPGWIRYRTGNKPPSRIQMSDGPMDILRAYLYDFYYETLMIEFKSDRKYDMVMTLRTSGRNPGYLQGKPLKLNINLEQNLLASVQSMMLTYDLPNKLKERLEKAGIQ